MEISRTCIISCILTALLCITFSSQSVKAQDNSSEETEVYLEFRHRGIINTLVISYYKDDSFYLPVTELFNTFSIDNNVQGSLISGKFGLAQVPYRINFNTRTIQFGEEKIILTQDDFIITELDFYLRSDLFEEAFELNFRIDFNNLQLNLSTERELPIIANAIRAQRRLRANRNRSGAPKYDLKYDRTFKFIDGGFLDYNLSGSYSAGTDFYNYTSNIGLQLLGGDLQGSLYGSYSDDVNSFDTNNLRWRLRLRDQNILTNLTVGQTRTDGLSKLAYTGIRLSNEPIEPRNSFDEFEIQGQTLPLSDIELYLNNTLIDFTQADELGNYRFLTPISYGSSQLDLRIFGQTGQVLERSRRVRVPFTFQPQGVLNYTFNAGVLDNPLLGETDESSVVQGMLSYGITNWLTAKSGFEYYGDYSSANPSLVSNLSARLSTNYIFSVESIYQNYYRGFFNVVYPNSASISLDYTDFVSTDPVYNSSGIDNRLSGSIFYPVNIGSIPFSLRTSGFSTLREDLRTTRLRFDANTRFGRMNIRAGYSDRFVGNLNFKNPSTTASLSLSTSYSIPRNSDLPNVFDGMFLRSQFNYYTTLKQMESAEFTVSRNIFSQGRLQASVGRNFFRGFNTFRFSLVFDFNFFRNRTTFNNARGDYNLTQNIRGSVGYDTKFNNFIFTSRDQVGRSGTAVKMYVDKNSNGSFDEEDQTLENNAVRVQRSGASSTYKNGVLYFTQMQPDFFYNMEVNKSVLDNPLLVPSFEQFGLITEPNNFKKVEIPFYMSGVVEGVVQRVTENSSAGIGGIKIIINGLNNDFYKEMRTFSDGSFYDYEIPPGRYSVTVDPSQLSLLSSVSVPNKIEFEVEALAQGDFIEGLLLKIIPEDMVEEEAVEEQETLSLDDVTEQIRNKQEIQNLENTLKRNVDDALKLLVRAQIEFYNKDLDAALALVDQSLAIYETSQAYALKGSLYYFKGNRSLAQRNWDMAIRFDPDIYIPDMRLLDEIINTNSSD